MGFVKQRANMKSKVTVAEFDACKQQFIFDLQTIVELDEIPPDSIINWDHNGLNYVPVCNWTLAKEGSSRVAIADVNDKWQSLLSLRE